MTITSQHKAFQQSGNRPRSSMRGASLVKLLLIIPVVLVLLLLLAVAVFEGRKAYWDYQVREMCEKDGGVLILEHIRISREQEEYLPHAGGVVSVASESLSDPRAPAFARTHETILRDGQPAVIRLEQEVVRRLNGRRVVKAVIYLRTGGDMPSPAFPSSFYCPPLDKVNVDLSKTFIIEESEK